MQAIQLRSELELGERAREIHVGEDEVRLRRVVGAADQHGLGALADELEAVEVADERMHRQREHALALQRTYGRIRGGLHLGILDLDPVGAQGLGKLRTRPRGRVRHEPEPVAIRPQTADGLGGARGSPNRGASHYA